MFSDRNSSKNDTSHNSWIDHNQTWNSELCILGCKSVFFQSMLSCLGADGVAYVQTHLSSCQCSWCPQRVPRASSRVTAQQYHSRYEDICPPTLSVGRGSMKTQTRSLHGSLNLLSYLLISSRDRCTFGFWTFWKHEDLRKPLQ